MNKEQAIAALETERLNSSEAVIVVENGAQYFTAPTLYNAGLNKAIEILRSLPDESDALHCGDVLMWHGTPAIVDSVTFRRDWTEPEYEIVVPSDENQRYYGVSWNAILAAEPETARHQHTFGPWLSTTSYRQVCSCGAYNESSVFADGTDQNRPCAGCGSSLVHCYDARNPWVENRMTACCPDCDHRKKETDNG